MENKISFVFMLSLKEMALKSVAINLWKQWDILISIENFSKISPDCCNYSEIWRETVENKVIHKLSKLLMPESLSKQLMLHLTPIGLQISRWKVFHEHYLEMPSSENVSSSFLTSKYSEDFTHLRVGLGVPVLEKLRWTVAGTIDYRKTAEELIRFEMVDVEKQYRLACLYCLEDSISLLWEDLNEGVKRKFYNGENISRFQITDIPYCWSYILKGEQFKLKCLILRQHKDKMSFNKIALIQSAGDGNKAATEFFFQRLSNEERNVPSLTRKALVSLTFRCLGSVILDEETYKSYSVPKELPPGNSGDVLCYLLSLMDYKQQMDIIQSQPITLLKCFMEWSWHDISLKIADIIWGFLSTEKYKSLLDVISHCLGYSNYSYPMFFQKWYTHSPIEFKRFFVVYECDLGVFFPILFDNQDSGTIEVVLRNADAADRMKLVSSKHILKLFYDNILKGRWHMVEVCLREARLSKDDKKRMGKAFMECLCRNEIGQIEKSALEWMKFLRLLDETGEISQTKRISKDETQNKAKKLRIDE